MGGYDSLKEHVFFEDIEWDTIPDQTPPKLMPYLPSNTRGEQGLRSEINVSVDYSGTTVCSGQHWVSLLSHLESYSQPIKSQYL